MRVQLCNRLIVINVFVIQTVARKDFCFKAEAMTGVFQEEKGTKQNPSLEWISWQGDH